MLLAVVVLFTLTELPQGVLTLMNFFNGHCFTKLVYDPLGDILDMMALVNNSINFVLYCTMSTQFRNTFMSIFCPAGIKRPQWLKLTLLKKKSKPDSIEVHENGNSRTTDTPLNNSRPSAPPTETTPIINTENDVKAGVEEVV